MSLIYFFFIPSYFQSSPLSLTQPRKPSNAIERVSSSCSTSRIRKSYIQVKGGAIGAFVHSQSCTYQDFPIPSPH